MNWKNAQRWENEWWGNCCNTWQEEMKQTVYLKKMGLQKNLQGKSITDIGGGVISMLLKCTNYNVSDVIDPIFSTCPQWVLDRYYANGIIAVAKKAEDIKRHRVVDEVWIYNCLQHTEKPEQVIKNAKKFAKIIRIFEWINIPISEGHIHELTEDRLNQWLGGEGKAETINESGAIGDCYYGIFKGDRYEK